MTISNMASQLDDLKDHIKCLEQKIEHSSISQSRQSPTHNSSRGVQNYKIN